MELIPSSFGIAAATVLGLLMGSFLNVVIHRLPLMLERRWAAECASLNGQTAPEAAPLNLMHPRSRCPHCGAGIAWYQNIPIVSWAMLRGRCRACQHPIGWRYPAVELLTGVLFAAVVSMHGLSWAALAWCGFVSALIALAFIDWDTTLLPDDITLPLAWAGLGAAALGWTGTDLHSALWGAFGGYLSLWSVYWAFKLITGKEGMGYGDFKLFAGLGAWFGWQALIPIILLASVAGAVIGIAMKFNSSLREGGYVPFGPFLAAGGLSALLLGTDRLLRWVGL
jgi:leader peptidase (prepilin peptidase)/N-methyltransferase